jgi:hypothetical protein
MTNANEISTKEAIEELSRPTGDAQADEVRQGMAENLRLGYLAVVGRSQDGELQFRLTSAGKQHVENMGHG